MQWRRVTVAVGVVVLLRSMAALGQVVSLTPIIRQIPTDDADARFAGQSPPESESYVTPGIPFYVELWAGNTGKPFDGLACVTVDLSYDRTDIIDAVPPVQNSPLFPIGAVSAVFDDSAGTVGDIGGCQVVPADPTLGVDEWVLVERIEMDALMGGGVVTISLQDADNLFAQTNLIGSLFPVDPADIDFQERVFSVGQPGVPAASEWSLVVMGLLQLIGGTIVLARRPTAHSRSGDRT